MLMSLNLLLETGNSELHLTPGRIEPFGLHLTLQYRITNSYLTSLQCLGPPWCQTNKQTRMSSNPIEVYHKLHYNSKMEWINEETHIEYENILKMEDEECVKLVSAGTTITPEMLYEIEKNAVKTVCIKPKTLRSGWEASS